MVRRPLLALGASALLAVLAAVAAPGAGAQAAERPTASTVARGNDVSYPQCGAELPQRGHIAVVGVNAGTGTTTNPCLAAQLAWGDAIGADGTPRRADVYINTANPGHLGDWWPRSDLTRAAEPVANPFGACAGAEDSACAYVYGYSIALDDLWRRGVTDPADRTWWLDVETMNSWSWNRSANLAVIEGMAAAIRQTGAEVGVYSTDRQWDVIVGTAQTSSALAGAPSWIAGAVTEAGALANCGVTPLTPGGRVRMAQWVERGVDHDTACAAGVSGTRPEIVGESEVGGSLLADPGPWGPEGTVLQYRWYRDGLPIEGATRPGYEPVAADAGARLSVEVTGSRAGAPVLRLTSPARAVAAPAVPVVPVRSPVSSGGALSGS